MSQLTSSEKLKSSSVSNIEVIFVFQGIHLIGDTAENFNPPYSRQTFILDDTPSLVLHVSHEIKATLSQHFAKVRCRGVCIQDFIHNGPKFPDRGGLSSPTSGLNYQFTKALQTTFSRWGGGGGCGTPSPFWGHPGQVPKRFSNIREF